jgi:hypothetical protein
MNVGVQRELRPGMVLTVDYVRNVGLHYLVAVDANHAGDAAFLNIPAAQAAVKTTLADCGLATIQLAATTNCPTNPTGATGPYVPRKATIQDFAGNGLDSPGDLTGGAACGSPASGVPFQCAFGGINPNFGSLQFFFPGGRSVYNAMDIKFVENKANPFRGVKYMNFQASYTLSRFDNAGGASATNPGNPSAGDQDFLTTALDFRNPLRFMGPSTLDRTHQLNFGGYADLPLGFRVGMIAHFWSSLPTTPTVPNPGGSIGAIFQTDFTGDGTTQDILPGAHVGSYGRQFGPVGLGNAITAYNTNFAGVTVTPAGQALINQGALLGGGGFTTANLIALGATPLRSRLRSRAS